MPAVLADERYAVSRLHRESGQIAVVQPCGIAREVGRVVERDHVQLVQDDALDSRRSRSSSNRLLN